MVKYSANGALDDTDLEILRTLQGDARIANSQLARRVRLSPPATHARVKRLEREGYVLGYGAVLDRERAGFDLLCFVRVSMRLHQYELVGSFREEIRKLPEVLECHNVTGDFDYLLKVAVRNRQELEGFVVEKLTPIEGIERLQTSVVLNEIKSTTELPL